MFAFSSAFFHTFFHSFLVPVIQKGSFNTYRIPKLVVGSEFGICKAGNFKIFYSFSNLWVIEQVGRNLLRVGIDSVSYTHLDVYKRQVFRNVTTVLVVPLLLALLSRRFLPKWVDKVKNVKDLGFYMWCFNLTILMGETVRNMLHAEVSGVTMLLLLFVPLLVCLLQFAIGKAVGRHFGASISAGQALGQKNTVVGIWLTLTFLNPLAAVAPGAYVVWQNLFNGCLLYTSRCV